MRRKSVVVAALTISLTCGFVPNTAHSVSKVAAGAVCKSLNQKVVASGKQFICIKSGKKLVWNKGVKVATPTPTPTPTPTAASTAKTFTKAEIAVHNSESDCWTFVDSKVYNLTAWLPDHPGGAGIVLGMCGTDGTEIFRDHHHAEQDAALLIYYIGELK